MAAIVWEMNVPSSGLLREPKLQVLTGRSCCLWWVAEKETGGGQTEALLFTGVEAYKTTYMLAYSAEMLSATYDDLVDLGQTTFLSEIRSKLSARTDVGEL